MSSIMDRSSILKKYTIDLSKYKVIKKIKSGGFGSVYKIQDKKGKGVYAAKVLTTESTENEQHKKMINRELSIMIRIQHPTIIRFYGFSLTDFDEQNNVTIIMSLAEKGSLSTVLEKVRRGLGDFEYNNTIRQKILVGIARGMMHLHQNRVIHRDLKPDNILIDSEYNPHITDFGLSKFYYNGRSSNQTLAGGTAMYMAPEVIRGERYDIKADVYSFGILMFEVITDSSPYPLFESGKMTVYQLNDKVVRENYRPEFKIPVKKALKKLMCQCWSADPKERPTFEEIFNKLAFNIEDTVCDIVSDEESSEFYLEDVDADEVVDYVYEINEGENKSERENGLIEKIDQIEKELVNQKKLVSDLSSENEELKNRVKKNEELIAKLVNENKEMKKQLNGTNKTDVEPKKVPSDASKKVPAKKVPSGLNILSFSPKEGKEFSGIIDYLTNKTGSNIHDNGTIEVTSNSIDSIYHPKNLLDQNKDNCYEAKEKERGATVVFDFKDMEIEITKYTIKAGDWVKDFGHIKNWVIEISNDLNKWTTIDKHSNSSELNGLNYIKTFNTTNQRFSRYCRFRHTGDYYGINNRCVMGFQSIEFYGRLKTTLK